MYIIPTIRTSLGTRSVPPRPMIRVSLTPAELNKLIRAIERDAESAEREGQMAAADHLARRAATLRAIR
jgi:hypothetical protein